MTFHKSCLQIWHQAKASGTAPLNQSWAWKLMTKYLLNIFSRLYEGHWTQIYRWKQTVRAFLSVLEIEISGRDSLLDTEKLLKMDMPWKKGTEQWRIIYRTVVNLENISTALVTTFPSSSSSTSCTAGAQSLLTLSTFEMSAAPSEVSEEACPPRQYNSSPWCFFPALYCQENKAGWLPEICARYWIFGCYSFCALSSPAGPEQVHKASSTCWTAKAMHISPM